MSSPLDRPVPRTATRPFSGGGSARPGGERALDLPSRLGVRACGAERSHDSQEGPVSPDSPAGPVGQNSPAGPSGLLADILALHDALAAEPSLEPGPRTDALFTALVALAVAPRAPQEVDAVLADPRLTERLPDLRARCATGEYALERAWAHRVLAADDPHAALEAFPYLQNYRDLTRIEYHAVAGHAPRAPRRALFVGSGPLPLSALLLARHGVRVDAVDIDPEAVELGGRLAAALGDDVRVAAGDVLDLGDLAGATTSCAWPPSSGSTPARRPRPWPTCAPACGPAPSCSPAAPTRCAACSTPCSRWPAATSAASTRWPCCTPTPTSSTRWCWPASRPERARPGQGRLDPCPPPAPARTPWRSGPSCCWSR